MKISLKPETELQWAVSSSVQLIDLKNLITKFKTSVSYFKREISAWFSAENAVLYLEFIVFKHFIEFVWFSNIL